MQNKWLTFNLAALALVVMFSFAEAQQITYQAKNPNFGGNSFNAAPLLNSATAQNSFTQPAPTARDSGQEFAERLDRAILSRISRNLTNTLVDNNGNLIAGINTFDTGINTVTLTNVGGTAQIEIVNNATGAVTVIDVPN